VDADNLANIALGLSHPTRIQIMEFLKEKNKGLFLTEIVEEISKIENYKSEFQSVKGHVLKMHFAGIVELTQKDGQYYVQLLKDVKIEVKDVSRDKLE